MKEEVEIDIPEEMYNKILILLANKKHISPNKITKENINDFMVEALESAVKEYREEKEAPLLEG